MRNPEMMMQPQFMTNMLPPPDNQDGIMVAVKFAINCVVEELGVEVWRDRGKDKILREEESRICTNQPRFVARAMQVERQRAKSGKAFHHGFHLLRISKWNQPVRTASRNTIKQPTTHCLEHSQEYDGHKLRTTAEHE